jgi:hypothetical protein
MQKLKQLYRSNYAGENIVSGLTLSGGEWTPEVEYVPNQVFNTYTTNQAVSIGNGESRLTIDLQHIANHKGGLFGSNRLQSYGCNALYRDFATDFLIAVGDEIIEEIANSGYCEDHIVYANADSILKYPGKFYLIPQNVHFDAGAISAYLACFDGHKKIFLLGYDNYPTHEHPINNVYKNTPGYLNHTETDNGVFFILILAEVMKTYTDVEFVRVMQPVTADIPASWMPLPNFRQIDYNDFVREADIG